MNANPRLRLITYVDQAGSRRALFAALDDLELEQFAPSRDLATITGRNRLVHVVSS